MSLNERQKKYLRTLAHSKKPVVLTGAAGISEALLAEVDVALTRHELIKMRINAADREERQAMIEAITGTTGAELVQRIGHVAVLYRQAEKPQITLPK
ncbi:ribosome assembly RNA-binding protein YhbY [Thiohalomonas denitrificans]|uniref:RNA-binding protein n=1 Tax=Thiohalomonas denitrificans TaxID=415747 RepID=A0A1G5PJA8_9GAMM|nr:ribosome assembly RNA-binding protein YhbY [Thiohalomonas denitrificans]SCZ49496.1 RNA-binding protein [Thiohalomonas denitrificans]